MTDPVQIPTVSIGGLRIPVPLTSRIFPALRDAYPTITDGLGDEAVVRAVLKWIITTTLSSYEGKLAEDQEVLSVENERERVRERGRLAREQAQRDAEAITEVTPAEGVVP